jgi:hypothetical protein
MNGSSPPGTTLLTLLGVPGLLVAVVGLCLIAWARWLRRRLPDSQAAHWLPLLVGVAVLAPVALGVSGLINQLLDLLQALGHVHPSDKQLILSAGLREIVDQAKRVGLILAIVYLSALVVLAVVTVIERRVLRGPVS